MTENAERFLKNASRIPLWNAIVTPTDVDDIFNASSGTIFCNGHLREIQVKSITDNTMKIFTEAMFID